MTATVTMNTPALADLTPERALYSVKEAALILGVTVRALREWEYQGRVKAVRLGSRVMFPASTIETIVSEGVK